MAFEFDGEKYKKVSSHQSVADNKVFVQLVQMAQKDGDIREKLMTILSLSPERRKVKLKLWINAMQIQKAPGDFISAVACLVDDAVADKVLEVLKGE